MVSWKKWTKICGCITKSKHPSLLIWVELMEKVCSNFLNVPRFTGFSFTISTCALGFGWGFLRISSAKVTYQVQHFFPCQYSIEDGPGSEVICDLDLRLVTGIFSPKNFGKSFSENLWQCQKWDFQHLTVERPLRRTSKNLKAGKVAGTTKSHKSWGQDIFKINRLRTFLLPSKSPHP